MLEYKVDDMTCNHCVNAITQAIKEVAPSAQIDINLDQHIVRIDTQTDPQTIQQAIAQAGYTPVSA